MSVARRALRRFEIGGATVTSEAIMSEIMAAIGKLHGGDQVGGRNGLQAVWSRISASPEPFHECVLSHYMADAQDDPADELAWDLRALDAAMRCDEGDAARLGHSLSIAAFMPSLHASLGEDYLKVGELAKSREHLAAARATSAALADDAYGKMIRGGIERLARKLEAAGA